jgi:signal transduction histidine kinase
MPAARARALPSLVISLGMATAFVAAALSITMAIGRLLPFTFFLAAVILAAWFRGAMVGLYATALSILALDYFVEVPAHSFAITPAFLPRVVTFTLSALTLLYLVAARHRAEDALRAARDELEARVRERTATLARTNDQLRAEIDERRRGDERLAAAAVRLARAKRRARERVLGARFAAQLEERTRLAREIHDTLLQGFTGVSLQLLAAMGRRSDPAQFTAALSDVLVLAQKTLADARRAVWDMRPPALEEGDFASALETALARSTAGSALALDYTVRGAPRALPPELETVIFRVAQEAIVNVVKHAGAHTARVTLSYEDRSVRLIVSDDGTGFIVDPERRTYAGHWGLLGMRERASQLRGKLVVRSAPGAGTRIMLRVPSHPDGRSASDAAARPPLPPLLAQPMLASRAPGGQQLPTS